MIIGPGSPVIFVGPDVPLRSGLTVGALYFVAEIGRPSVSWPNDDFYRLRDKPGNWIWYCASAFKPLGGEDEERHVTVEILEPVW